MNNIEHTEFNCESYRLITYNNNILGITQVFTEIHIPLRELNTLIKQLQIINRKHNIRGNNGTSK
jgi:hypothetical protein